MKLTTQDGRKLELNPANHIECGAYTLFDDVDTTYSAVCVAELVKGSGGETVKVNLREDVGIFENSQAHKVAISLWAAVDKGANEFTIPQPTETESKAIIAHKEKERLIKEYGLTLLTINELGYKPSDISRNLEIWRKTDEFERRGILVCDLETHDCKKSLAKWQALQRKNKVATSEPKGYAKRAALRRKFMGRCSA